MKSATHTRRGLVALLVLTVAYLAIPWSRSPALAEAVGLPVAILFTVLLPGVALLRLIGTGTRDRFERAALAALLGMCVLLACTFVWTLWRFPIGALRFALPVVVWALWLRSARSGKVPGPRPPESGGDRRARRVAAGLFAFIAVVAVVVYAAGPPTYYSADTIDHIAYVNEIVRTQDPFPTTAFYEDPGANGADLRKSLLHAAFGLYATHLGLNPIRLFAMLNALFLVLVCLSVYAASRRLFGSTVVAVAAVAVFLIGYEGGLGSRLIRVAFYPNRVGIAPLLLFVSGAMAYLERPSRRDLALCAAMGFTAAAVHVQFAVLTAIAAGIIVLWKTCSPCGTWRDHLRRSIAAGVAAGVAILPYVVYRLISYQTNDLHNQVQGAMFVWHGLFVVSPFRLWDWLGWTGLAAIASVVPLWHRRKRVPGVGYGIASLVTVLAILLNPVALPAFFRGLSYVVFRIGVVAPFFMLAAFFAVDLWKGLRRSPTERTRHKWIRRAAAVVLVVGLGVDTVDSWHHRYVIWHTSDAERAQSHESLHTALTALDATLPPGTVVASDPVTSYFVSAMTPHYVVCTLDQHAPPNDRRADERMAAARDILSPYTSVREKALLMDREGADVVVINEALPKGLLLKFWTQEPSKTGKALRPFRNSPDVFEPVWEGGGVWVYRWTGIVPEGDGGGGMPLPVVERLPADATRVARVSGDATLVGARVGAESVARGGGVPVDLYWSRETPAPSANYVVTIRFDYDDLELPMGGRPFPKIARKLREKLDGVRYRFRRGHLLLDGLYGPDRWRPDEIVHDRGVVRVPRDVAPGTYVVRARLRAEAAIPNTDLRSYFFDDDMYSGVEIGRVEILPE